MSVFKRSKIKNSNDNVAAERAEVIDYLDNMFKIIHVRNTESVGQQAALLFTRLLDEANIRTHLGRKDFYECLSESFLKNKEYLVHEYRVYAAFEAFKENIDEKKWAGGAKWVLYYNEYVQIARDILLNPTMNRFKVLFALFPEPSAIKDFTLHNFFMKAEDSAKSEALKKFEDEAFTSINQLVELQNLFKPYDPSHSAFNYLFPVMAEIIKFINEPTIELFNRYKKYVLRLLDIGVPYGHKADDEGKTYEFMNPRKRKSLFDSYPALTRFYLDAENSVIDLQLNTEEKQKFLPIQACLALLFGNVGGDSDAEKLKLCEKFLIYILSSYKDEVNPALENAYNDYVAAGGDEYINAIVSNELNLELDEGFASRDFSMRNQIGEKNYTFLYTYKRFVYNSILYFLKKDGTVLPEHIKFCDERITKYSGGSKKEDMESDMINAVNDAWSFMLKTPKKDD